MGFPSAWLSITILRAWTVDGNPSSSVEIAGESWRRLGREAFIAYMEGMGCTLCRRMAGEQADAVAQAKGPRWASPGLSAVSSSFFGCSDAGVLLPALLIVYQATHVRLGGKLPGILVDGGAHIGKFTERLIGMFADSFGRRLAKTGTSCVICPHSASRLDAVVVSVEPFANNFELLRKHAEELGWVDAGWIGVQRALGDVREEADFVGAEGTACDELAKVVPSGGLRKSSRVEVVTIDDLLDTVETTYPEAAIDRVFLLKLDIEGLEPRVIRSLTRARARIKFLTFEYNGNLWTENLYGVIQILDSLGYFCFFITPDQLFPVSHAFWDNFYALPIWSNFFCGHQHDPDLETVIRIHSRRLGPWSSQPGLLLAGPPGGDTSEYSLELARARCEQLGQLCVGVACQCEGGQCDGFKPVGPCTLKERIDHSRRSPKSEVTFLKDVSVGDPFLQYTAYLRRHSLGVSSEATGRQGQIKSLD